MVNLNMNVPANVSWPTPGNTLHDGFDYGKTVYELSNHLGNVLATISDQKDAVQSGSTGVVGYYKAVSMTQTDYYPFGMQMVGRSYRMLGGYRYGFNGKENDDEVKGVEGSQQDYGMRIYDPRIGKFLSVDPLAQSYPMLTPYQFASNTPVSAIDIDGLEANEKFDPSVLLKDGIEYFIKQRASEAGILIKIYVNLNPYTRFAVNAARGITKQVVIAQAKAFHNSAISYDKYLKQQEGFYHSIDMHVSEFGMYEQRIDLSLQYNSEVDGYAPSLPDLYFSGKKDCKVKLHDYLVDGSKLTESESIQIVANRFRIEAARNTYQKERGSFNHALFLYNFMDEFTAESITYDVLSYYKDKFDWSSKKGKEFIEEFNKLKQNFSEEGLEKFTNSLINNYIYNSVTEKAYRLIIVNLSQKNDENE